MQLKIDKKSENVLVLTVEETRLDAAVAVEFKQALLDVTHQGHSLIVLNLSEVDFVDSSGLGAIITGFKATNRDGGFVLCGANDRVLALFKMTRMDRVFQFFPDEAQAIAALQSPTPA